MLGKCQELHDSSVLTPHSPPPSPPPLPITPHYVYTRGHCISGIHSCTHTYIHTFVLVLIHIPHSSHNLTSYALFHLSLTLSPDSLHSVLPRLNAVPIYASLHSSPSALSFPPSGVSSPTSNFTLISPVLILCFSPLQVRKQASCHHSPTGKTGKRRDRGTNY